MVHECEYLLEHELDDRSHPALCGVGGLELLSKLKEIKDSKRGAAEMDPIGPATAPPRVRGYFR